MVYKPPYNWGAPSCINNHPIPALQSTSKQSAPQKRSLLRGFSASSILVSQAAPGSGFSFVA
jgi:hypothetical protein